MKCDGLGLRSAVQLAPSTFWLLPLPPYILPLHLQSAPLPSFDNAVALWSYDHDQLPPEGVVCFHQSWDSIKVSVFAEALLDGASDASL